MRRAPLALALALAPACLEPSYGTVLSSGAAEDPAPDDSTSTGPDSDADSDSDSGTTGEPPPVWDGEPLPPADPGEWRWIDFPDARCRTGEPTGVGLRYAEGDDLLIYFQGGGACFNPLTCLNNPKVAAAADFYAEFVPYWGDAGIFRDRPDNPVRDFNVVYVPYCSGDVFAGDREDVEIEGHGAQQFVGYHNLSAFLDRVVPTFRGAPQVLIAGASAGGFGATFNAIRIARSFPESQVTILNDSAPLFTDDHVPPCLQQQWRDTWGLSATLPPGCDACSNPDGGGLSNVIDHVAAALPGVNLGLVSSTRDATLSIFYAFGVDECSGYGIFTGDRFQEALYQLREAKLAPGGWGTYLIPGNSHVWTQTSDFYNTEVAGVPLTAWLAELMAGDPAHVAP